VSRSYVLLLLWPCTAWTAPGWPSPMSALVKLDAMSS